MFDSAACCRMRLATVPTGGCDALLDLKALLRCAPFSDRDVLLQTQHRSLLSPGGADAKVPEPTQGRSSQTVSSTPEASGPFPKLENVDSHRFIATAAESRHRVEPGFT